MTDNWLFHRAKALLIPLLLTAFFLRMYRLAGQPLSWDEGWSLGLSALPGSEINRITALDVHPPLYYYLLKLWLALGRHELLLRFLSALLGFLTVPLASVTARAWIRGSGHGRRGSRAGLLAAFAAAISPILLYYSQVARMFALCTALSLVAAYCLLRAAEAGTRRFYLGFVLTGAAAIYTFYYSAFVLAAVFLYALLIQPRRWRAMCASAAAITLLYLPWLIYAMPPMLGRVGTRAGSAVLVGDPLHLLADSLFGLVFAYGTGWVAVYIILLLWLGAMVLAWRGRASMRHLTLPALAIALTVGAVSVGARAHMFAARYLISASPYLALLTAWAIGTYWQRSRWLGVLATLLVAASALPTLAGYVYEKPYEVSEAFDPQADYRFLKDRTAPDDVVFYNVLSLAGHYERYRSAEDAEWSYVLRWDPVVEPLAPALTDRVLPAAGEHRRLWFVLYKGTVAANLELKQWLDQQLFPSFGQWREDVLYLQYLPPTGPMERYEPGHVFGQRIRLRSVEFTSAAEPDAAVTVRLEWEPAEHIERSYKVFVHLYAADGRLVTQHDSIPVNELRPTWSWQPGEQIADHHGLWLPDGSAGPLRLVVGLYDPETSDRLRMPDGSDHAEIGTVHVGSRGM
jgi:hypothetical protein